MTKNLESKLSPKSGRFKEKLQLFARGLLVPITLLAFAGLFLGIGAVIGKYVTEGVGNIFANVLKNIGNVVFYLLPLLFAVAIASSMTNNNGTAILAAIVIWVAIQMLAGAQFKDYTYETNGVVIKGWSWFGIINFDSVNRASIITKPFGFNALNFSVFGGFISGPIAVYCYNKFKDQRMPLFLQMFQGQRFVPIMGIILAIPTSFILALTWPWFQKGFIEFGQQTGKLPGGIDSFLFGLIEAAIRPTGLHHMFYSPLLYTSAGATVIPSYNIASGVSVSDINYGKEMALWVIDAAPFGASQTQDLMKNIEGVQLIDFNSSTLGTDYGLQWNANSKTLSVTNLEILKNSTPEDLKILYGDRTAFQTINGSALQFSWINNLTEGHSVHLGRFAAGKLPMMVFGIPAAGAAIILAAPKESRKLTTGVIASAASTSFLTGITEPFEYSFLFLAPFLYYGFHIWLVGLSYLLANVAGVYYGPTFGGIIDFFIYGVIPQVSGQNTYFWWLIVIGIGLAVIYFFGFYFLIIKFNLKTPGRGSGEIKLWSKQDYRTTKTTQGKKLDELTIKGQIIYQALGKKANLVNITNCASRLRVTIKDPSKVNYELVNRTKPFGIIGEGKTSQQFVYGPSVQTIADVLLGLFEGNIKEVNLLNQKINDNKNKKIPKNIKILIKAPTSGKVERISNLKDEVFSKKMLGEGVFIKLKKLVNSQKIYAPISGKLITVFPGGHAYGIKSKEGVEILLHIGIDTVNLKGKGFKSFVKQGQEIKVGELLAEVNTKLIATKVLVVDPILVVTSGQKISKIKTGDTISKKTIFETK